MIRKYNVLLIGDGGNGKSTFILQFITNSFLEMYDPTIEDSYVYNFKNHGNETEYQIHYLDTAGQYEYLEMFPQYYKNVDWCLIFIDLTQSCWYDTLDFRYKQMIELSIYKEKQPFSIVFTKLDRKWDYVISDKQLLKVLKEWKFPFYFVDNHSRNDTEKIMFSFNLYCMEQMKRNKLLSIQEMKGEIEPKYSSIENIKKKEKTCFLN